MSQRVHTSYGPGVVTAEETVRGRRSYKVEGDGFSVWLDATQIEASSLLQFDESPPHVDRDNFTHLPYDPRPQYPAEVFQQPAAEFGINSDERLSPSNSLTFEDVAPRPYPGPNPDLFATAEELDHETGSALVASYHGLEGHYAGSAAHRVDRDSIQGQLEHDPVRFAQMKSHEWHAHKPPMTAAAENYLSLLEGDVRVRTSAWADVRAKAVRLRNAGNVEVIGASPESIYAYVMGDHGVYETIVVRGAAYTGKNSISEWDCSCEWGQWAFQRQHTYVGRLCSHAYAAYMELQSMHQKKTKSPMWMASTDGGDEGYEGDYDTADEDTREAAQIAPADGNLTLTPGTLTPGLNPRKDTDEDRAERVPVMSSFGIEAAIVDIQRVVDPEDQALLDRLRDLSAEGRRPLHQQERNLEMRKLVKQLHERGYNAENLTASLRVLESAPGDHQPFNGSGPDAKTEWTSSEDYVDTHERPRFERVDDIGANPAEMRVAAAEDEDHGFRVASMDDIKAFGDSDPLSSVGIGGGGEHVASTDPGLELETPLDPRVAASMGDDKSDLAHLLPPGMARTAGRTYSQAEQDALINEAAVGGPLDQRELDLRGTHYLS